MDGTILIKRDYGTQEVGPDHHDPNVLPFEIIHSTQEGIQHVAKLKNGKYEIDDLHPEFGDLAVREIRKAIHQSHKVGEHRFNGKGASIHLHQDHVIGCYVIPLPPLALLRRGLLRGWEILKAITTVGAQKAADGLTGLNSLTLFNNANAYIGVGDSSTAFSASQTDLQAASNKTRQGMDSTYPSGSAGVITFSATFATGSANYAWNEWGVFNAASSGSMLSRKVESLGTKTSAQSWQIQATLTFAAA